MNQRAFLAAGVLISSVLVGCGSDDDPTAGTDQQIDGDVTDGGTTDDTAETDEAPGDGGGADDEAADGGETSPLGEVTIGQTETHINGVELTIHSLRVEQNAIFVDIEAFNGSARDVLLAGFGHATVIDDAGEEYRYEPPEDNTSLRIESNGTLEGSIAFIGRAGAGASSVTVQFNYFEGEPRHPSDEQHRNIDAPSFEFADLPLPGA